MTDWVHLIPSVAAAFSGSLVECAEALTVILAVGAVRGWRPTLIGTGVGLAFLAGLVLVLGSAVARLPIELIHAAVGALLLLFGMRWLRKAILRAAGALPLRDEAAIFGREWEVLLGHIRLHNPIWDPVAIGTSLKIVLLEGIETVFIVIAVGTPSGTMVQASLAAGAAFVLVASLGVALHRPLTRIPENTLKFAVGVLLSAFGTFWLGEGVGVSWPGADWAAIGLIGWFSIASIVALTCCGGLPVDPVEVPR